MLVIRQVQIDAMSNRQKKSIADTIAHSLKQQSPFFQYYTPEQLNLRVTKQIDYLASLHITNKNSVTSIIEVMAFYGDKFERSANPSWALDIIEDTERNENIRATCLEEAHEKNLT